MNRKSLLLGTTMLAGAAIGAGPAIAGTVGSGDNLSLTLSGEMGFNVFLTDQDVSAGNGRGYNFHVEDAEIAIDASATADNGLEYGVSIELNAAADDGTAADESWAYIDATWGRIEMGDQDDVGDRMFVAGHDLMAARGGIDGDVPDLIALGSANLTKPDSTNTGDATKVIYFTPRFNGFQLGASLTPDSGANGFSRDADNDGDYENVVSLAANYEGAAGDFSYVVSVFGEFGTSETSTGADAEGDLEFYGIGATVSYQGWSFGAGWADLNDSGVADASVTAGADAGEWWDIGAAYATGPWTVSVGYFESEQSNTGTISDTEVEVLSIGATYGVAPGWDINAEVNFAEGNNTNQSATPTNNDGTLFTLNSTFAF